MAASVFINKSYSEEDITNIDKAQFALEIKIKQPPLKSTEVSVDVKESSHDKTKSQAIPVIKEIQFENGFYQLNNSKDKFR